MAYNHLTHSLVKSQKSMTALEITFHPNLDYSLTPLPGRAQRAHSLIRSDQSKDFQTIVWQSPN